MKPVFRFLWHWGLLLHIYISMAGFALVLLFAITGLTLNHDDFGLGRPVLSTSSIEVSSDVLERADQAVLGEYLRKALALSAPMTDYRQDADQIQVTFAAPGRRTVVTVSRSERRGEVESETRGLLGKLDDLHRGLDSGPAWSWIIDLVAVMLSLSALTGMVTLASFRARRRGGFIIAALGVVSIVALYLIWVPH